MERNYEPMILVQKAEIIYKDSRCKQKEYAELVEELYKFFNDNQEYFEKLVKASKVNVYLLMMNEYQIEGFNYKDTEILKKETDDVTMLLNIAHYC